MPILLQRFTTVYAGTEDRIRLSGEDDKGCVVVLWLTQRLLKRLIPALIEWHEKRMGNRVGADVWQGFAQSRAVSRMEHQPPVAVPKAVDVVAGVAPKAVDAGVIESIDVVRNLAEVRLLLKTRSFEPVELSFGELKLRQWLDIVYRACSEGGWTGVNWPEWVQENSRSVQSAGVRILH